MPAVFSLTIGSLFGGLIIWLAMTSRDKWKKGRGLMAKPAKQAEENKKKMEAAKADRSKGWGEIRQSIFFFLAMLVGIFLLFFFINAVMGM